MSDVVSPQHRLHGHCSTSCRMCCGTGGIIAGVAVLAWFGLPAFLRLLSTTGLDFTLSNPVLVPIVVGALGVIALGLWLGVRSHGRIESFMIGVLGAAATIVGMLMWAPVAVMGLFIVVGAIAASQVYLRAARQ